MGDAQLRYMLFSLNERRYAIEVENVAEIAEIPTAYPIPFAPRFMRGVVNIHGKIAAILDLALFSGVGTVTNDGTVLLLNCPDTSLALIVDQMERIISSEEIISREAGEGPLEQGRLILSDGPVTVIARNALLDGIERMMQR